MSIVSHLSDVLFGGSARFNEASPVKDGGASAKERAKQRWLYAIAKVRTTNALSGSIPMFPIERLSELKELFRDPRTGNMCELDENTFCKLFGERLKNRRYTECQLRQWFKDVDIDASNRVSWEEFTTFNMFHASNQGEQNSRSRLFHPCAHPMISTVQEHKDVVPRILSHERCQYIVTGSYDGVVKLWHPTTLACVKTINNSANSVAHSSLGPALGSTVCPITDMGLSSRGTQLFVAAVDKTIHFYDTTTWDLTRRYIGRLSGNRAAQLAAASVDAPVVQLHGMFDAPVTVDMASPADRDLLFVGFHDGSASVYPALKHVAELPKAMTFTSHSDELTKLRYIPSIESLLSSSWDCTLAITDLATGKVAVRLDGGEQGAERHNKGVIDFAFNHSLRMIGSVSSEREALLWNPFLDTPIGVLRGHMALLQSIAFDEIDNVVITLDHDNVVKLWDLRTYNCLQTITTSVSLEGTGQNSLNLNAVLYDSNTSCLVAAGPRLLSWKVQRANSHFPATHLGHIESVVSMTYVPSTRTLVTSDANTMMTWDVRTGKRELLWDCNPEDNVASCVSAFAMDMRNRRVLIGTARSGLKVVNYRNAQSLRDTTYTGSSEASHVVHLSNMDGTSKLIAVVSPAEAALFNEFADPVTGLMSSAPDLVIAARCATIRFTCAAALPSVDRLTTAALVLGDTEGLIAVYSSTTGMLCSSVHQPQPVKPPPPLHFCGHSFQPDR